MKPLALPPVDGAARLAGSSLGRSLGASSLLNRAAALWARLLETTIEVSLLPPVVAGGPRPPWACAGWVLPDGRQGVLAADTALLAGRVGVMAGATARSIGPVPLSPAESGLFAYLATAWLGLLDPVPALDWVDGGVGTWDPPRPTAAIRWRLSIDGAVGLVHWWAPPVTQPPDALRSDLPLVARLLAGRAGLGRRPAPGDLVVLQAAPHLAIGPITHPLIRQNARWRVASAAETRMTQPIADLPLTIDAVVGQFTLTVAEASALARGSVLPLAPDPTPEVRLMIGDQLIAVGMLVDDDGRAAVQITRVIDQSSSRT